MVCVNGYGLMYKRISHIVVIQRAQNVYCCTECYYLLTIDNVYTHEKNTANNNGNVLKQIF